MLMAWKMAPFIGTILLLLIAFVLRPWIQYRRYGTWGVLLFRSKSPRLIALDGLTVILFLLLPVQAYIVVYRPDYLAPYFVLDGPAKALSVRIGVPVFFGGLIFFAMAQLKLGASWRIGIDRSARLGLITDGLYSVCRHPVYLGLLIMAGGYVLMLPTLLSLTLAAIDYAAMRKHIADEESYLLLMYGDEYRRYASKVGRFLPGFGRR
jgi:protein-S-isoprenylcysteine O-methyltransferase Ste14